MNKKVKNFILYFIISVELLLVGYILLRDNNILNTVTLSKAIEFFIICILIVIAILLGKWIRKKYSNSNYSYGLVTSLGIFFFLVINIFRHSILLVLNWKVYDIFVIYNHALESFSDYVIITLPCIIILAIYSIISNIVLIRKEGTRFKNLLGIVIGLFAIIGLFGSQALYFVTSNIAGSDRFLVIKYITDIFVNTTLVYFYSIMLSTLYISVAASKHVPKYDKDYIIILGCMIRKDGTLAPLLRSRVDKALEFARTQKEKTKKDIIFIPSGGQGADEVISEAEAMKNYLLEQGIKKDKIIAEDKSTNTYENMKYSYALIKDKKNSKICFATNSYHVYRSGVEANNVGMKCEGIGSKTKWYFGTNALIREFIAALVKDRKKHLLVLLIIYVFAVILIAIGYHYNMINLYR